MTQTTKDKLLEILGDFSMDELSVHSLLEVLQTKLKNQADRIEELYRANGAEKQRLTDEIESIRREHKELRCNPASIMSGPFFFYSPDSNQKFMVQINRGRVESFEDKKGVKYVLQQIPPDAYEAKV